jgi:hypothetical protein
VTSDRLVKVHSSVVISIFDNSSAARAIFDIKATVVWGKGNGVGLQFV